MKPIRIIIVPLLSFAALALSGNAPLAVQSVSPVLALTIITTAPYTNSAPGWYQLGANLTYNGSGATNDAIITINAGNVTLDFAGHYITGPINTPATGL